MQCAAFQQIDAIGNRRDVVGMKSIFLAAVLGLLATATFAQDAKAPVPTVETWTTSEGKLTIQVLPFSFEGTYDQDNGRMVGTLGDDGAYVGFWGEGGSSTECKTTVLGTKYWGRIAFTFDKARQHFDGKWSYCDGDTDSSWTGDIAK